MQENYLTCVCIGSEYLSFGYPPMGVYSGRIPGISIRTVTLLSYEKYYIFSKE
jgi:hypothetical protein